MGYELEGIDQLQLLCMEELYRENQSWGTIIRTYPQAFSQLLAP
jgi:hypothetical protein